MKPELLVLSPIFRPAIEKLERDYTIHKLWESEDRSALMRRIAPTVRGAITTGLHGFTREHVETLPNLEIIAVFGRGHDSLDMDAARARGIVVTNTRDRTAESAADLAVGLLLASMRRICEADRFVRRGDWEKAGTPLGHDVFDKTCGIVGFGEIGRAVAQRVQPLGMRVAYHGPRRKSDVAYGYYADLEALARASDCLVIACPLTDATRGTVNAPVLSALGAGGFLVNVARGAIVDQRAMIDALQNRTIAGAALDVFWDEPRVPSELLTLDNVVLTPHIGTTTREIREQRTEMLVANLRAHFAGAPVPNRVD